MADPTQQLQQMLNNAESSFGGLNSAGQQLASALLQAAKAGNTQTNAATATSQSLAQLTARSASVEAGFTTIGGALVGLVGQATNLTAGIYGADKAFTSVIPTVDAMASVLGKMTTGLGELVSSFKIFKFALGKAPEGFAKILNAGLDIVTNILKFQLETSQKVADQFISAAKVGALFGGSITRMAEVAADARIPIQTLVKVITANADSLSKLGLGQEKGAAVVSAYTRKIFDSDRSLRILYGSFEELSVGVTSYLTSQAQLGISATQDYEKTKAATIDYLYRQKELTAITGKSVELSRREEEARRNQLDYNLKLSRLGTTARANVEEGMAIAGKVFGSEGVKYAEEYFATGGKVVTKASLAFQATQEVAAGAIANMLGGVDQSSEGFRTLTASILQDVAPAMKAFAQDREYDSTINRAANNSILAMSTSVASAFQSAIPFIENIGTLFKTLEAERANMKKGPLDKPTIAFTDAQNQLLINQSEIDKTVLKNMESIGETLRLMHSLQLGFIGLNDKANELLNKIIKGEIGLDFEDLVTGLGQSIFKNIQEAARRSERGAATPDATPTPNARPVTPTTPNSTTPDATPIPDTRSVSQSEPDPIVTAAMQSEIDRLNREVLAMRNTPPPVNGENTDLQKSMLAELQDHTSQLSRIRDALA